MHGETVELCQTNVCVVCLLLRNSLASNSDGGELSRRKHTTFRTRRKFEIKNVCVHGLCYRYHSDTFLL